MVNIISPPLKVGSLFPIGTLSHPLAQPSEERPLPFPLTLTLGRFLVGLTQEIYSIHTSSDRM